MSETFYADLTQSILDILKADTTLKKTIKKFYFGEHDIRKPNTLYPFIDIKWFGGPVSKTKTGAVITRRRIVFNIRCIHKDINEEIAEKLVMEYTRRIETVLDADGTLGGKAISSKVTEVLSDSISIGGYSVIGSLTKLETKH